MSRFLLGFKDELAQPAFDFLRGEAALARPLEPRVRYDSIRLTIPLL